MLVGWQLEPLRADNFDFNLIGPDWLSLLAFTAIALFQGVLVVALVARLSRGVPPDLARRARRPDPGGPSRARRVSRTLLPRERRCDG